MQDKFRIDDESIGRVAAKKPNLQTSMPKKNNIVFARVVIN